MQHFLNDKLAAGFAPATVDLIRRVLRNAFAVAVSDGLVHRNPVTGTHVRIPDRDRSPLDIAQSQGLLEAARADGTTNGSAIAIAQLTGLRPGELLGLCWGDVNLEARSLQVRRNLQRFDGRTQLVEVKTRRAARTLPLPGAAIIVLVEHRDRQPAAPLPTAQVFMTRTGGLLEPRAVSLTLKRLLVQNGLPDVRLYDLRHMAASWPRTPTPGSSPTCSVTPAST